MSVLIEEARQAAAGLEGEGLPFVAGLLRRLADSLDTLRVELEDRTRCHQQALELVNSLGGLLGEARGILESARDQIIEPGDLVEWDTIPGDAERGKVISISGGRAAVERSPYADPMVAPVSKLRLAKKGA